MRRKRSLSPAAMAVLSGICALLWLYRVVFRGEDDLLTVLAGVAWTASALVWGFRAYRAKRKKEGL